MAFSLFHVIYVFFLVYNCIYWNISQPYLKTDTLNLPKIWAERDLIHKYVL